MDATIAQAVGLLGIAAITVGITILFVRLLLVVIITSAKLVAVLGVAAALVWIVSRMFG